MYGNAEHKLHQMADAFTVENLDEESQEATGNNFRYFNFSTLLQRLEENKPCHMLLAQRAKLKHPRFLIPHPPQDFGKAKDLHSATCYLKTLKLPRHKKRKKDPRRVSNTLTGTQNKPNR